MSLTPTANFVIVKSVAGSTNFASVHLAVKAVVRWVAIHSVANFEEIHWLAGVEFKYLAVGR